MNCQQPRVYDFIYAPIPLAIIGRTDLEWIDKVLLARLILYAGKDGQCFPAQQTLAQEFGVHRQRINSRLAHLERLGLITSRRTRQSKRYQIHLQLMSAKLDIQMSPKAASPLSAKPDTKRSNLKEKGREKDSVRVTQTQLRNYKTNPDYQTTNRKRRDSSPGEIVPLVPLYPALKDRLFEYFKEDGHEDLYPADGLVADVMREARGATESQVIAYLDHLYYDRGLRPGTKHGPRHWQWFKAVVQDRFA